MRFAALWLCTALVFVGTDRITEPETGETFDAVIQGTTPGTTLTLTGVACRKATIFAVKVYGIGHWIEAEGARAALSEWRGKPAKALQGDQRFFDALSAADVEKRFRLQFVRDVDAEELRGAFHDALVITYSDLPQVANNFLDLFKTTVKKGQAIEVRSLPGGTIELHQNGALLGRLENDQEFATAVWKCYFNKKLADQHLQAVRNGLVTRIDAIWQESSP